MYAELDMWWCNPLAQYLATVDTCSASAPHCFCTYFLSCFPVFWPRSSSTLAVVCACACWFCWLRCTSPCVPFDCCRRWNGEVAQLMLQLLFLHESGKYFHEPLVLCSHLCAVRALCRGVWEPSMTKSSSSSRARDGGVAKSLTPR